MQDYSNQQDNPYASPYAVAAQNQDVRAEFIRKTYLHLAGAIAAFAVLEYFFFQSEMMLKLAATMMGGGMSWLIVLGAFMGVSMLANKWAHSNASREKQYMGLGLYIVAEAIIFLPLLLIADRFFPGQGLIMKAGLLTAAMTTGLTVIAFTTKKDFTFLDGFLKVAGMIALGLIVISLFTSLNLGMWFSAAMVLFASLSILRDTSNIMFHYNSNQYVAASLGLFASVALLFWYILQILMSLASGD